MMEVIVMMVMMVIGNGGGDVMAMGDGVRVMISRTLLRDFDVVEVHNASMAFKIAVELHFFHRFFEDEFFGEFLPIMCANTEAQKHPFLRCVVLENNIGQQ